VWDVLGKRVLTSDRSDATLGGFASLGHCIVAGIEIFTFLDREVSRVCGECKRGGSEP